MSKEPVFSVWFKGKELKGTRAELRQLSNDVDEALSRATELCDMKPPKVVGGTLSYDSMQDFFRQAYPGKSLLGSHATQLFNQLLNAARPGSGLIIYCSMCQRGPFEKRCIDNQPHSRHAKRFLIDVLSLKKFAPPVIEGKTHLRGFGDMLRRDLRALVEKL